MKIVQVIVNLERGDAIGNFTLMLEDVIKKTGYETEIYAARAGKGIEEGSVKKFSQLKGLSSDDILIYQMCESNPVFQKILKFNCKKMAIYHNVTPPVFFKHWGNFMIECQTKALKEIASMNQAFDWCIADSEFNKNDLVSMGYDQSKIDVIPIITDFEDYKKVPSEKIIKSYKDDYTNILFVGRIVPNKKQEDIIRAFTYYKKNINKKSRLILVGTPFSADYYEDLLQYIGIIGVEDVIIPGHISFEEILGFYASADIFLCMSEHEGFCVPLLEAMMFKVPIIAYDSTAIPYTLGQGGILVDTKDPVLIAELIDKIVNDSNLREIIVQRQERELEKYDRKRLERKFLEVINKVIKEIK